MSDFKCGWCGKTISDSDEDVITVRISRKSKQGMKTSVSKSRICKDCDETLEFVIGERGCGNNGGYDG